MNMIKQISLLIVLCAIASLQAKSLPCAKGWHKNKDGVCVKNGTLDRARILNEYPGDISIQLVWRNKNALHNRFNTNEIVKRNGHNTFKAPFLGYDLEKITITPTAIAAGIGTAAAVATAALGAAALATGVEAVVAAPAASTGMVAFDGNMQAHKNRYFVVSRSKNKVKGTSTPKLIITAYKNESAYKASKNNSNKKMAINTNTDDQDELLTMEL